MRKINRDGLAIIKCYEGLKLEAYLCPGGRWSIGYGHTTGVKEGDTCTAEQAEQWLIEDIETAKRSVASLVDVPVTDDQFSALVSLVFNIGSAAFRSSTLLRKLNYGEYLSAGQEFSRWTKAGGKDQPGLIRRRKSERELFMKGVKTS